MTAQDYSVQQLLVNVVIVELLCRHLRMSLSDSIKQLHETLPIQILRKEIYLKLGFGDVELSFHARMLHKF